MILTAHQPAFLPWLGWIHKAAVSDVFVLLDGVQFEKNSYTNRNRIRSADGWQWITIPVSNPRPQATIAEMQIVDDQRMRRKGAATLRQHYEGAPQWERHGRWVSEYVSGRVAGYRMESLASLLLPHATDMLDAFGVHTPIYLQSEVWPYGRGEDMLIALCKHFKADAFLFGAQGRNYCTPAKWREAGITPLIQEYHTPEYRQRYPGWIPDLAAIDLLMNAEPAEARDIMMRGGSMRELA